MRSSQIKSVFNNLPSWGKDLVSIGAFVGVMVAARGALADHYQVPTGSMQPTVEPGDRVVVDKRAYGLRIPGTHTYLAKFDEPAPGDVVVLSSPENEIVLLKRVVGVPGDRIEVRDGWVIRNGKKCESAGHRENLGGKSHAVNLEHGGGPDVPSFYVPADQFLVMGDNRGNSHDGRMFGLVQRTAILGRAVGVFERGGSWLWQGL